MVSKADRKRSDELAEIVKQKYKSGDYEGLIALLDEAITLDPDNYHAWNNRGVEKGRLGQNEAAIKDYDEAIRLKPDYSNSWFGRGTAKGHLGQHEEAIKDFDEAIRLEPYDYDALNNRGNSKYALSQYEEAIKDYDEVLRLRPDNDWAWNNRGAAKARLGQIDEAIKDIEEAVRLDPKNPGNINNLAAIRAEKYAHEAIEERLGSIANTRELRALAEQYRKEHQHRKKELNDAFNDLYRRIVKLVAFLVIGFGIFYAPSLVASIKSVLAAFGWISGVPNPTAPEFNWFSPLAFTPWLVMIALIVSPKVTAIRVLMQRANKAELMEAEYTHLSYVEKRVFFYFAKDDTAEGRQIKYDYIKATMGDSPSDKLLAIINRGKGKTDDTQSAHERIINEFRKITSSDSDKTN